MKNLRLKDLKLYIILTLTAGVFLFSVTGRPENQAIMPQLDEERVLPFPERRLPPAQEREYPEPEYVEGEVLIKLKEDVEPQSVLQEINLEAQSIERTHSIKPVVHNFKKVYKLEKDSNGWYWFFGKSYKEVAEIPDEDLFKEAYKEMSPSRQGLYRNYRLILSEGESVEDAVVRLRDNPNIEYAYPNYIREVNDVSIDPRFSEQWGLHNIRQSGGIDDADIDAPEAWDITEGERDIIIAIIDTGVDYNHEDLFANIWVNPAIVVDRNSDDIIDTRDLDLDGSGTIEEAELNQYGEDQDVIGWDFVTAPADNVAPGEDYDPPDNDPMDFHGHGTHCSGIAAAVKDNLIGIAGVAPNCRIMALRAGYKKPNGRGSLRDVDIERAILYAADNGARVISMSFGGSLQGAYVDEIATVYTEEGYAAKIVLVAAAGNYTFSSFRYVSYPAAMDEVIAVAATDQNDNRASFSCYGDSFDGNCEEGICVEVAAPGVSILSSIPNNQYASWKGTSMACPHVAGIAALVISENPLLTNEEVRQILRYSSDEIGPPGKDGYFGYGRANAYKASLNLRLSITSPVALSYIRDEIDILGSAFIDSTEEGFQRYELYYAPKDNPEDTTDISPRDNDRARQNDVLGTWDTIRCAEGEYILTLKLITTTEKELTHSINVSVDNINQPPVFTNLNDKAVVIGRLLEFKVEAHDPDDPKTPWGELEYSAYNLPSDDVFDPQTQIFSWQPGESDNGLYEVTFTVSDKNEDGNIEHSVSQVVTLTTVIIEEVQITTDPSEQVSAAIHQDKIVWQDYRSGTADISMYVLSTDQEIQVTADPYRQETLDVHQDKIVWCDDRGGIFDTDIYMRTYDSNTNKLGPTIQITADPGYQFLPVICQDKIAWIDWRDEASENSDIYVYNLSTGQKILICTEPSCKYNAEIYEDKIIWQDYRNGNADIYMCTYDFSTGEVGTEIQITTDLNDQTEPAIYQDKIVWQDYRNGPPCIYMYDITTGEEIQITTDPGFQWYPAIYEDKVVWRDYRNGNYDIYMYDIATGEEIQITADPCYQQSPAIHEDKIVWYDNRSGNYDVYMARIIYAPQIISVDSRIVYPRSGSPSQILTITGKNFGYTQGDSTVEFGNGAVCPVESWSNTRIICRVPAGAKTGLLKIVTLGGESNGVNVKVLLSFPPKIIYYFPRNLTPSVDEGGSLRFYVWAYDPDGDPLTFTWKLDGVRRQTDSGQGGGHWWWWGQMLSMWIYNPDYNSAGKHSIICEVSDGINRPVSIKWSVTIHDVGTGYGYGN